MAAARKVSGGAEQHRLCLAAEVSSQLAGGRGFAGAIDANHHDDERRLDGWSWFLMLVENRFQLFFEQLAKLCAVLDLPPFRAFAKGSDDFS